MAKEGTGISRITESGEQLRIEGLFEGKRSDYQITKEQVDAFRKAHGEQATREMFERQLRGGVEGQDRDLRP